MAERTSVTQIVQVGPETTSGTSVPADTVLPSLQLTTSIDGGWTKIMASGHKVPTNVAQGKEWTSGKITMDVPTYDELPYLLCALFKSVTPVLTETTAQTWTYTPDVSAPEAPKTLTVEQGSSVRAHKFSFGTVTELTFTGDRDKLTVDGAMVGQQLSDGITLTASPTTVAQVPVLPSDVSVYMDTTGAGIGATKLTRVLSWEYSVKNVNNPLWVVDAAADSWTALVNTPITGQVKLKAEADATAMALLASMRNSTRQFVRIEALSSQLAGDTSATYALQLDACCQIATKPSEISDSDGVYAIEFTFDITYDATWAKFLEISVTNKLAAL